MKHMITKLSFLLFLLLAACNLPMGTDEEDTPTIAPDIAAPVSTAPPLSAPTGEESTNLPTTGSADTVKGTAYYVGQAGCSDAGPGDEQTPFCSFQTALDRLLPGDMLIIQAGVYAEPLLVEGIAGRADAPIVIRGESRDAVIFDGGCPDFPCRANDVNADQNWEGMVIVTGGDYLTLSDITVRNNIGMGITIEGGNHTTITNTLIDGMGNGGIIVEGDPVTPQIIGNEVRRTNLGWLGEDGAFYEGDNEAISIIRAAGFVVANNNMHDVFEEGIVIKESSNNGDVYDNLVARACAVGIYIDEAHDVRLYNNQVSDTGYYIAASGQKQPCGDYFTLDAGVLGDYYGSAIQLSVGDLGELSQGLLSNIQVYQNLVWGCHLNGLESWDELLESGVGAGQMTGIRIYNNVFYNCGVDGVGAGIWLEDIDDAGVVNNIIALNSEDGITGNGIENAAIANNLFYFTEDWQEPVGADYVTGDPLFVDPENGDFHLQAGSPAIDRGTDAGLPAVDAPDIGAFEYGLLPPTPTATAPPTLTSMPESLAGDWWQPAVNITWQWQLGQPIDPSFDVDMYDIDLFESDAEAVTALHAQGRKVICYISVGSWEDWRPDAEQFPAAVIGRDYGGWPGEKWLDIRQIDALAPIMRARLDLCRDKGFDGVEPDNIDAYTNNTGFPLTYEDQLAYNIWLADEAHARGLSIGLKNNGEQVVDLLPYFDWALTEDCFDQEWCEEMQPFIVAGKPVFAAEYTDTGMTTDQFCPAAAAMRISAILKNRDLDAWMEACPALTTAVTTLPSLADVQQWLYLIDVNVKAETIAQIVASTYDMVVLDFIPSETNNTDYPMAELIASLHNAPRPKLVIAYIDIGQAENFRTYWQPGWGIGNPEWIITGDPDGWEGNFPVAYWYEEYQDIWLGENGYLQAILDAGFDGVYLDWVEAYSDEDVAAFAAADGADARQEMIWWVGDMADFMREQNPDSIVIGQNAAELTQSDAYVAAVDAVAQEQVWFDGAADNNPPGDCPLPRTDTDVDTAVYYASLSPSCQRQFDEFPGSTLHVSSEEYLRDLQAAQSKGLVIFTVDYALEPENVAWVYAASRGLGFVPFAGNRALDRFIEPIP